MLTRRKFIMASVAGTLATGTAYKGWPFFSTNEDFPSFISCCMDNSNHYAISRIVNGKILFSTQLPGRGHASLYHETLDHIINVARRPNTWLQVTDAQTGELITLSHTEKSFHFNGHACLSADRQLLLTSETSSETQQGYIGVYDCLSNYRFLGHFSSGGIDPHEFRLLPNNETLAIANGGIIKDYSSGMTTNADTMESSITRVNISDGRLLQTDSCDIPQMSLRHMDLSPKGDLIIGGQYQGDASSNQALVFVLDLNGNFQPMRPEHHNWLSNKQYIASIVCDEYGHTAVSTSPKAGKVDLWNLESRQRIQQFSMTDVAGAFWHKHKQCFVTSNSLGQLMCIKADGTVMGDNPLSYPDNHWDNHMLATR